MDTVIIRDAIEEAMAHEASTHELASLLRQRLHCLHSNIISLSTVKSTQALLHFVCSFINRTPNLLDTILAATRNSSREDLGENLVGACVNYYTCPPPLLSGWRGLNGITAKSYLSQRMIEEINDYCAVRSNVPLLPVDLTGSNLIIHQIIGEHFANLLDELVNPVVNRLRDSSTTAFFDNKAPPGALTDKIASLGGQHLPLETEVADIFYISSRHFSSTIH